MSHLPATSASLEDDVRRLRQDFEKAGLFSQAPLRTWFEMVTFTALFGLLIWLGRSQPVLATALLTVLTIHVGWWIHEAGHDAIFKNRQTARRATDFFGIVFLGMPQAAYHFQAHRRHHGLSNVIGRDGAIETGPIVWDHAQEKAPRLSAALQPFAWFFGVLPFTFFFMAAGILRENVRNGQWLLVALTVLRWYLALRFPLLAIVPALFCCSFVGLLASLSHFHLPMSSDVRRSHLSNIFETTQNISLTSPLWTWVSGGLNFHVEHHLFPQMPSRHYPRISASVRELAARHGLPFHEDSLPSVVARVWQRLRTRQSQQKVTNEKAA